MVVTAKGVGVVVGGNVVVENVSKMTGTVPVMSRGSMMGPVVSVVVEGVAVVVRTGVTVVVGGGANVVVGGGVVVVGGGVARKGVIRAM